MQAPPRPDRYQGPPTCLPAPAILALLSLAVILGGAELLAAARPRSPDGAGLPVTVGEGTGTPPFCSL